ncbi:MAG: hypothetical protein KDD94_09360, partial [Calditrichaeota bacterium]|nr:hypothetical protein [Calditrichota bacterium]
FRPLELVTSNTRVASLFFRTYMDENYLFFRADRNFSGVASSPSYYNIAAGTEFNLFIAGYQFQVEKNIGISPNFTLVTYDLDGIDSDYLFRLTFAMKW